MAIEDRSNAQVTAQSTNRAFVVATGPICQVTLAPQPIGDLAPRPAEAWIPSELAPPAPYRLHRLQLCPEPVCRRFHRARIFLDPADMPRPQRQTVQEATRTANPRAQVAPSRRPRTHRILHTSERMLLLPRTSKPKDSRGCPTCYPFTTEGFISRESFASDRPPRPTVGSLKVRRCLDALRRLGLLHVGQHRPQKVIQHIRRRSAAIGGTRFLPKPNPSPNLFDVARMGISGIA